MPFRRPDFSLILAKAVDEAWLKTDYFDFSAVVIDHELKDDIAAAAFRQRFITLNLNENAAPESVAVELSSVLHRGSALVQ